MAPWPTWCKRFHLSSSECVEITGGDQALFHLFLCKSLDERRVLHKDMVIKPVYPMQCWMQAACRWIPPVNRKRVPNTTPMRISGKGPLSPYFALGLGVRAKFLQTDRVKQGDA